MSSDPITSSASDPTAAVAPGFDASHPPNPKLIDTCVHCGFCLPTCPSYRVLGTEMDSPRGRIYLMDAINQGEATLAPDTTQHFDSCLGCLACVSACPSGVQYDQLIAATRPQVERNTPRSLTDRLFRQLIFSLFPYPNRLRWLLPSLLAYQKLDAKGWIRSNPQLRTIAPRLAAMANNLPPVSLNGLRDRLPEVIPAVGERRYRVGLILGCVQQVFFSSVNAATARVLAANGCEVVIPKGQGCCAALPYHQGQEAQAQELARQMVDKFADDSLNAIIINAAGCGHTLKEYDRVLQDDPQYRDRATRFAHQVKDIHEFLYEIGLSAPLAPLTDESLTVVYQDACHLLHGQRISLQPRQLLQQIPQLTLREPLDAALCCGSAGVYNLLQPETADELGQQKVENLLDTGATLIASANPGCSLQIKKHLQRQGKQVPLMHPIELLDASIRSVQLAEILPKSGG